MGLHKRPYLQRLHLYGNTRILSRDVHLGFLEQKDTWSVVKYNVKSCIDERCAASLDPINLGNSIV